jgi:4-hydroxybenzoate polyprenyltransferase
MNMHAKARAWIPLLRLDRPVGIYLLLWPTLWGLWVAGRGHVTIGTLTIFVCGTILMRSAGCVINDVADRHIDRHVARTKQRPLATGALQTHHALIGIAILLGMAAGLLFFLPPLCLALAMIGLLLAIVYPFCKRFFTAPQLVLGLAFAWGIPMAFAAQHQVLNSTCWLLYGIAALWPIAYDTVYAMVDADDDLSIGVHSTALTLGKHTPFFVLTIQAMVIGGWATFCYLQHYGIGPWLGVLFGMWFWWQLKQSLAQQTRAAYFHAFKQQHLLGLVCLAGLIYQYL